MTPFIFLDTTSIICNTEVIEAYIMKIFLDHAVITSLSRDLAELYDWNGV